MSMCPQSVVLRLPAELQLQLEPSGYCGSKVPSPLIATEWVGEMPIATKTGGTDVAGMKFSTFGFVTI
jgi:hypothetical protein